MFSPAMKMWAFVTCLQHGFMAQLLYIFIHNGWWVQCAVHENLGFKIKQTLRCSTTELCTVNLRVWKVKQRLGVFNLHSSEYQAGGHCTGCTKKSSCIEVYEKDDTLLLAWFIKLVIISSTACFKWIITQHDVHYVQKEMTSDWFSDQLYYAQPYGVTFRCKKQAGKAKMLSTNHWVPTSTQFNMKSLLHTMFRQHLNLNQSNNLISGLLAKHACLSSAFHSHFPYTWLILMAEWDVRDDSWITKSSQVKVPKVFTLEHMNKPLSALEVVAKVAFAVFTIQTT